MNKSDGANVNLSPAAQQFRLIPVPTRKHIMVNVFNTSKFYLRYIEFFHAPLSFLDLLIEGTCKINRNIGNGGEKGQYTHTLMLD